jgi:hypothetical protein
MESDDAQIAKDYLGQAWNHVGKAPDMTTYLTFAVAHALVSIADSLKPFNAYPQRIVFGTEGNHE